MIYFVFSQFETQYRRYMLKRNIGLSLAGICLWLLIACPAYSQGTQKEDIVVTTDSTGREVIYMDGRLLNEKQTARYHRALRRDSIRAHKKIWWSILGGPSYNPEASLGAGGAVLASFRMNKNDTVSQRSFLPAGFNISINGTLIVAGAGTFFFNENKFRIYLNYSFRNEPSHYYGKGYDKIEQVERSDSTTKFHKMLLQLYPRFVWEIKPNLYAGTLFDVNYIKAKDINPVMEQDEYFQKFKKEYINIGIGGLLQYDSRDDVATPTRGLLLSAIGKLYGKYLGGDYNFGFIELEYRQFKNIFRPRSTLAWVAKTQMGLGNVPYTELPSFGSPFDLRGYYWGQYRDKTMAYGIVEYRHMFGSPASYRSGNFWSKLGFVTWVGTGSIAKDVVSLSKWKFNYGVGLRIQMQPGKNFRLDVGAEPGRGTGVYFNMTEAF